MATITNNNIVSRNSCIIIGGGAGGLLAANILSEGGCDVILLEKKHQTGLKLRLTGKGRCNLTNSCSKEEFLSHISDKDFFEYSFRIFDNRRLMDYFTNKGIALQTERGNRVYPQSNKSSDIFFALINGIENKKNVNIIRNCEVKTIIIRDGKATGVITNQGKFFADNVLIATGGNTYQSTGSTGDGYRIMNILGHTIVNPIPALVGLRTQHGYPASAQNTEIKNCEVIITDKKKNIITSHFGDIYLDEYGVSGPVILTVSREIARELDSGKELFLQIDFKPKIDENKLYEEIITAFKTRRTENAGGIIRKWVIKPLAEDVLNVCKINPRTMGYKLTEQDAKQLLWYLKNRRERIVGDMGWNEAVITMGGVSLKEINPVTLQSKKIKNLYVAGELLDLDADTGGYNLQIAFSTAYSAAQSILHKQKKRNTI